MFPLYDTRRLPGFPIITATIIVINIVVFIFELMANDLQAFFYEYALVPRLIDFSQPSTLYTFITSAFLHGSILHILSNMWFLQVYGWNTEADLGKFRFIIFYISAAIVSAFAQYIISPSSIIPQLGASGAIAAVLGYYLIKFPHHSIKSIIISFSFITTAEVQAQFMLLIWGATQLFNSVGSLGTNYESGGVAWFAHLGGFIFGIIVGLLFKSSGKYFGRLKEFTR